jgi:hypothetical protein
VHAKDLFVNNSRSRQTVEAIREGLPELDTKASFAFIIESVDAVDGSALVVSSENKEVLGVLDLVSQQQANGFQALFPTIHVVSEENVVGLGREASVLE